MNAPPGGNTGMSTTPERQPEDFELDIPRYELRLDGRSIRLERQPMELLMLLAERSGQLVTRDDIVARLWGDGVFVDADRGINKAIHKIRVAFRDDPESPRFVETVVGKGYRLSRPSRSVRRRRGPRRRLSWRPRVRIRRARQSRRPRRRGCDRRRASRSTGFSSPACTASSGRRTRRSRGWKRPSRIVISS